MTRNSTISVAATVLVLAAALTWFVFLQPAREVDAARAEGLLATGIQMFDGNQFEEAIATLKGIPEGSPQAAQGLYYEGSAYLMLKDYETAAARLEEALALQPRDSGVLYALGVAYYRLGNLALAKGYFAAVLEINPNDEQAKGLMDIMARLERQSGPAAETE